MASAAGGRAVRIKKGGGEKNDGRKKKWRN